MSLQKKILTIVINKLLSENLIILDYNQELDDFQCRNDKNIDYVFDIDDMKFYVHAHYIGFGEIAFNVYCIHVVDYTNEMDIAMNNDRLIINNILRVKNYIYCHGWLERRTGKFIQDGGEYKLKNNSMLRKEFFKNYIHNLKTIDIQPNGYLTTGPRM